jgi:hypothetical protein
MGRRCVNLVIHDVNAADMDLLSADDVEWFGTELRRVSDAAGIRPELLRCFGDDAGFVVASRHAPQRLTFTEWEKFGAWCGHQHVPTNDHWDPGALDHEGVNDAMALSDDVARLQRQMATVSRNVVGVITEQAALAAELDEIAAALKVSDAKLRARIDAQRARLNLQRDRLRALEDADDDA